MSPPEQPLEQHVAEARRLVQRQKGLIVRLSASGVSTLDAQMQEHRDRLKGTAAD